MNLRQAAQQALEALENAGEAVYAHGGIAAVGSLNTAAQALRAALAEPEQEPVASLMTHIQSGDQKVVWNDDGFNRAFWHETPLYTAPTPRKPQTTHWEGCEAVHPECKEKA